jgi:hypothetical protein
MPRVRNFSSTKGRLARTNARSIINDILMYWPRDPMLA